MCSMMRFNIDAALDNSRGKCHEEPLQPVFGDADSSASSLWVWVPYQNYEYLGLFWLFQPNSHVGKMNWSNNF